MKMDSHSKNARHHKEGNTKSSCTVFYGSQPECHHVSKPGELLIKNLMLPIPNLFMTILWSSVCTKDEHGPHHVTECYWMEKKELDHADCEPETSDRLKLPN